MNNYFDWKAHMNLTEKQQRWTKQLTELWSFFDARVNNHHLKTHDLRLKLLLTLTLAAHRLIRGFLAQLRGGSNDNLQSKLRTLTEACINIKYILSDEEGFRARAFVLDSDKKRLTTVDQLIVLMEQEKAPSMAAIASLENYIELRGTLREKIAEERSRLEENATWHSIEQRAIATGMQEDYRTVFYLFSQDNHMSADSLEKFLRDDNGVTVFTTALDLSDLDNEIQTAYIYYFQFIYLCSVLLGFLTEEELIEFRNSEMFGNIKQ
jgi:hypothetical protein